MKDLDNFNYSRLKSVILGSTTASKDAKLLAVVSDLINGAQNFKDRLLNSFNKETDKLELASQVNGVLLPVNGGNIPGIYRPVITLGVNCGGGGVDDTRYTVFNRFVYVAGLLQITAIAPNTLTKMRVSLPVHSNFIVERQLSGVLTGIPLGASTEGMSGIMVADTVNGEAEVRCFIPNTDNMDCRFVMSYELL